MTRHEQASAPWHPRASSSGCVYRHILIAERALGHLLPAGAQVHHVDGDNRNNANANLVICESAAYHKLLHVRTRVLKAGGNPNTDRICGCCGHVKALTDFGVMRANKSTGRQSRCRDCGQKLDAIRRRREAA